MKRNFIFRISLVICFGFSTLITSAQQVNTLYFMDNVPIRHYFNPAFQPYSDFYLGLPILGYSQLGLGNNSLTLKDLTYKVNGKSIWFLNENGNKNKFFNTLKPTTLIQTEIQLNLIDFGFRSGNGYWTFGLTEKVNGQIGIPKDLMSLFLYGTKDMNNVNNYDFKTLDADITAYTEAAFGYSRIINNKLTIGGKLKLLLGNANVSTSNQSLKLSAGIDSLTLKGNGSANYSGPVDLNGNSIKDFNPASPNIADLLKPAGLGVGIDLGVTYKPIKELTLSAAVTDLGMIRWNKNVKNLGYQVNYKFAGFDSLKLKSNLNSLADSLFPKLSKSYKDTLTSNKAYTTNTSPKLNVGVEYSFFENKLSIGLLSRTMFHNKVGYEELTASVNGRPVDWFNMSLSYSVLNGKMSNIGAGLGLRTGFLNWFVSTDYIPLYYASLPINVGNSNFKAPIAYNTKGFNLSFGVNIVIGNRKDADHDGVVDRKDKCPETPFSVIVDRKGCPIDADGDGVPDYLDKCPKTPKEAYNRIDQNGCPVDNDSDGVADYLDKCPDTPKEAIGHVDSLGCPLDTDKDGVFDYIDKCPGTPLGTKVDSIGCPIDSDGDGVIDALDKCPGTPVAARGFVDKNGCPLDTDGDGVPDYLDKCPNTPPEERSMVDKDGCTVVNTNDSDGDGVPDSLDKCPGTPVAARGFVDKNGCPLDTDGDGVPDYQDKCPKVAGPASNNGCPEIKKEDKKLFQKALQGIQFETAKYVIIPVSYKILNQIAGVLIANPTYIVEIRGHTDKAGKSSANMILSANRAKAVMKYLINKGVDAKRMTANGYGDTLPIASNKTVKGKALNRRVEFVVTFEEITFE